MARSTSLQGRERRLHNQRKREAYDRGRLDQAKGLQPQRSDPDYLAGWKSEQRRASNKLYIGFSDDDFSFSRLS